MGEVPLQYTSYGRGALAVHLRTRTVLRAMYGLPRLLRRVPPPEGNLRALGMVLLQGPQGRLFLVSEVPMHLMFYIDVDTFAPRT